jgi:hypothetical protein
MAIRFVALVPETAAEAEAACGENSAREPEAVGRGKRSETQFGRQMMALVRRDD